MTLNTSTMQNITEAPKNSIEILPEHIIDQIKAGEVIERASSLLKEILENSIDAGSSEINIHIVKNGLDLISVIDNGKGMNFNELPFAFCRHATSKIQRFEDIYHLDSFGFRGEALASISAVSRVTCTSSSESNSPHGGKIIIEGGETKTHSNVKASKGTSLYIKDLFFNTPARLKFIKSAISEKNAIKRILDSFVISNPHIKFTIKWDDQDKVVYPVEHSFEERLKKVFFGKNKKIKLLSFKSRYENHTVQGFMSETFSKGAAHKKHFLFANGRLFTDRQIHQTILRSSEALYPPGTMGHYCVFIKAPENLIDVNIHPNKTQIRFFKLPVISALISEEIKKKKIKREEDTPLNIPVPLIQKRESIPYSPGNQFKSNSQSLFDDKNLKEANNLEYAASKIDTGVSYDHDLRVISLENKEFLISRSLFFKEVFNKLKRLNLNSDRDFIPLLISEPVTLKRSQTFSLKELEKMGFILDQLNSESLALRAKFHAFKSFNEIHKVILFAIYDEKEDLKDFRLKSKQVKEIMEELDLETNKFMREITDSFYEQLF